MSTTALPYRTPRPVARKVSRLRWLVRLYVLVEGLAAVAICLSLAFWLALALDWFFEPGKSARILMWLAVGAATLFVTLKYLLVRLAKPLPADSLALLIERQHPHLGESLVTAVQSPRLKRESAFQDALIEATGERARSEIRNASLRSVFNMRPLARKGLLALLLIGSIVGFAAFESEAFGFWVQRMQLAPQPWPRTVELTAPAFVENPAQKVARDDQFELRVLASIVAPHAAPDRVEVRYRLADGRRGRDQMIQVGEALPGRDKTQAFRYVFENVSQDIIFDVVGGDAKIRDLKIHAVPRPAVSEISLACKFPAYLQQGESSFAVSGRTEVPAGTTAECRLAATKSLASGRAYDASRQQDIPVEIDPDDPHRLSFQLGEISEDRVVMITLVDEDRVENRDPYRLVISAVPDEPPEVSIQLRGISTAVTPQAMIPIEGTITDDYGIVSAWYRYQVGDNPVEQQPIDTVIKGFRKVDRFNLFDLAKKDPATNQPVVKVEAGQKLFFSVQARDAYNLADGDPQLPVRVGTSQRFHLDVVSDSELRALLERRELGFRQRFEAIYEKMVGTRELLDRIEVSVAPEQDGESEARKSKSTEPETAANNEAANDEPVAAEASAADSSAKLEHTRERSRLRIVGASQNTTQLAFETLGVADGFHEIVTELINNRIDTVELKNRLEESIAKPLEKLGNESMPKLETALGELQTVYEASPAEADQQLAVAKAQADEVVAGMKAVLDRMLELENYNELVELLRTIVNEQEQLNEQTKQQQKNKLRSLLED